MTNNATTQRDRDNLIEALRECLSPEAISYIHAALLDRIDRDGERVSDGQDMIEGWAEAHWFHYAILDEMIA